MGVVVCGGGLQLRNITCVKAEGGQPLPPEACRNLQPPPTVQRYIKVNLIGNCKMKWKKKCNSKFPHYKKAIGEFGSIEEMSKAIMNDLLSILILKLILNH